MLYDAVKKKRLFSMYELTWAFSRPRKPQDRSLAYAQSFWTCQFITEKWGQPTILRMMELLKAGQTQEQVFQETLKLTPADFSQQFFAWAEQQVQGWGYDPETSKKYDELAEKAEAMIQARQYAEAITAWEELAKLRPMDALPHQRLAGLYLAKPVGNPQKAAEHLLRLHQTSVKDNRFAKRLARLYLEELNDLPKAEQFATDSVYVDPYDLDAHQLLASICEKSGNAAALEREKRVIPVLTEWLKQNRGSSLLEGAPQP
jgi:tetratricopeptide (TPR) repeat protein